MHFTKLLQFCHDGYNGINMLVEFKIRKKWLYRCIDGSNSTIFEQQVSVEPLRQAVRCIVMCNKNITRRNFFYIKEINGTCIMNKRNLHNLELSNFAEDRKSFNMFIRYFQILKARKNILWSFEKKTEKKNIKKNTSFFKIISIGFVKIILI